MAETKQSELERVERQLSRWRAQHGGRGRPIPENLWEAMTGVAGTVGVDTAARVLRVDRARLARRLSGAPPRAVVLRQRKEPARVSFVEVSPPNAFPPPSTRARVWVRMTNRTGEQLEVALEGGASAADVAAVARALWSRTP